MIKVATTGGRNSSRDPFALIGRLAAIEAAVLLLCRRLNKVTFRLKSSASKTSGAAPIRNMGGKTPETSANSASIFVHQSFSSSAYSFEMDFRAATAPSPLSLRS